MAVQTQIQVRRGTASSWTSTNPTLAAGEFGFETDTGKLKCGNGSSTWNALSYIGAANAIQYVYTASAGQTTFSGADNNSLTLSYTVGAEQVYVNGVLQVRGTDYTATNGTSVVLTTATIASDIVTIIAYGTFTVADTYTQAQANATFPLNTSSFFAGKNKIINGDFGVWQRGTSISGRGYAADRFLTQGDGSGATITQSQQTFTPGTAPVSGYEGTYFYRFNQSVAGSGATYQVFDTRLEDVRLFAGQTVTLSFWAKADATRQISPSINQYFGSGGSATVPNNGAAINLTTSWARYSQTFSLASISGKTIGTGSFLEVRLNLPINTTQTIDIWGVQLEAGSVATAFQTATGTIQGELAACQRYYIRFGGEASNVMMGQGAAWTSTNTDVLVNVPVTMRTLPTAVDYSTIVMQAYGASTQYSVTSASISSVSGKNCVVVGTTVASGLTTGTQYRMWATSSSGYLGLSAEL